MPEVFIKILSANPFCTTLVSPVTILKSTPLLDKLTSSIVFLIDISIFSRSFNGKPSSSIKERLKTKGVQPVVARSLTVPHMDNFPISPPGKKIGSTTKLSVVKAMFFDLMQREALSSSFSSISFFKYFSMNLFINSPVFNPPSPCEILITFA